MDAGFEHTMLDAAVPSKFLVLAPGCDGRRQRRDPCREMRTRAVLRNSRHRDHRNRGIVIAETAAS
jgi:hypothetical protein